MLSGQKVTNNFIKDTNLSTIIDNRVSNHHTMKDIQKDRISLIIYELEVVWLINDVLKDFRGAANELELPTRIASFVDRQRTNEGLTT